MTAYLVDTNILLRFVKPDNRDYPLLQSVVAQLWVRGDDLCYTSQNLAEFWSTCTRPPDRNGYGLTISEVERRARLVEGQFRLLEENSAVHREWRKLIVLHSVSGVQVYDARLVAAMPVHNVSHVLTFNVKDFARYSEITAVAPEAVVSR